MIGAVAPETHRPDTPHADTHRAIDAVWRIESPRLIAGLTRLVRDIARAEDLAQDALVAALEQWPATGIPGMQRIPTLRRMAEDAYREGSADILELLDANRSLRDFQLTRVQQLEGVKLAEETVIGAAGLSAAELLP